MTIEIKDLPEAKEMNTTEMNAVRGGRPAEQVTFEYGALVVTYKPQKPDGDL